MDSIPYIRRDGVCLSAHFVLSFPTQAAFVNANMKLKFTRNEAEKKEVLKSIYQEAKKFYANTARTTPESSEI